MNSSEEKQIPRSSRRRRPGVLVVGIAAVTLAFAASLASITLAAGGVITVGSASNSTLSKQIVVDSQGQTLYALSPETAHRPLCESRECLKFWPPLTVRSSETGLKAGPGVHGHLAILR